MVGQARHFDMGSGICCSHSPCIPMIGQIITTSPNTTCNTRGVARLQDIVMGNCGHIGNIITVSPNVITNKVGNAHLNSQFIGAFSGTIITASANTVLGM